MWGSGGFWSLGSECSWPLPTLCLTTPVLAVPRLLGLVHTSRALVLVILCCSSRAWEYQPGICSLPHNCAPHKGNVTTSHLHLHCSCPSDITPAHVPCKVQSRMERVASL